MEHRMPVLDDDLNVIGHTTNAGYRKALAFMLEAGLKPQSAKQEFRQTTEGRILCWVPVYR